MPRWSKIPSWRRLTRSVPTLDEVAVREERLERGAEETATPPKDIFNEIDFGSYFQEYLDPGYRTQPEYEDSEKPSFENFLSQPTTLSDHLAWQLGALSLDRRPASRPPSLWSAIWTRTATWPRRCGTGLSVQLGTSQDAAATNGHAAEQAAALDLIHRAIDLVHHLDPAGVGARDLRQCLSLQIAAQLQEFGHLYAKPLQEPNGVRIRIAA